MTRRLDSSLLLWKSISRQPEFRAGLLKLNAELTLRTFRNQPKRYLETERFEFTMTMKELLKPVTSMEPEKVEYFIFQVYECYDKERAYSNGKHSKFSLDIVFQVIEFLFASGPKVDITKILEKETSLEKKEIESIISHIKVFNKIGAFIGKSGNLKQTMDQAEALLTEIASIHMDITYLALESMFYLLVAQYALANKYSCESLLRAWMTEYGFDESNYSSMAVFFPPDSSLKDFQGKYANALRTLIGVKKKEEPVFDLLLLRSIGNYFSSWTAKVAKQMEANYQPTS